MSTVAETTLLTVAEVAKVLRLSTTAVRSLCNAGELPHHRVGTGKTKRVRIPEEEVRAYLDRTLSTGEPIIPMPPPRRPASRNSAAGCEILRSFGWKG